MTTINLKDVPAQDLYEALRQHEDFRILRKIKNRDYFYILSDGAKVEKWLVLDTETTGLNSDVEDVIEVGAILVEVDVRSGKIGKVLSQFSGLEQPSVPITPENQAIHGISFEMVKGKRFDDAQFIEMANQADYVLAHNAKFDRSFIDKRFPSLKHLKWMCSFEEIKWGAHGYMSAKLGILLNESDFFHGAHRAVEDVNALLHVLNSPLKDTGEMPCKLLSESRTQTQYYLGAVNAPFNAKDVLKQANFRWNAADKMWEIEVQGEEQKDEVVQFLKKSVYRSKSIGIRYVELKDSDKYRSFDKNNIVTL